MNSGPTSKKFQSDISKSMKVLNPFLKELQFRNYMKQHASFERKGDFALRKGGSVEDTGIELKIKKCDEGDSIERKLN